MSELLNQLKEKLEIIDYRLVHRGCDHWEIYNHKDIPTGYMIWDDIITKDGANKYEDGDECTCVCFNLRYCELKLLDNNCLTVSEIEEHPHIFIQFYNHSKKEVKEDE